MVCSRFFILIMRLFMKKLGVFFSLVLLFFVMF